MLINDHESCWMNVESVYANTKKRQNRVITCLHTYAAKRYMAHMEGSNKCSGDTYIYIYMHKYCYCHDFLENDISFCRRRPYQAISETTSRSVTCTVCAVSPQLFKLMLHVRPLFPIWSWKTQINMLAKFTVAVNILVWLVV